jgi:hypothetical protein
MSIELEAVERGEIEAMHAAVPATVRAALGLGCDAVGTSLVSLAAAAPPSAIVLNRAIGLGVDAPADRETVAAIVDRYAAGGVRRVRCSGVGSSTRSISVAGSSAPRPARRCRAIPSTPTGTS